jgi:hypothetical protein
MEKWKQNIIENVASMSNENLFEYVLEMAMGDTEDGRYTLDGFWEYEYVRDEFKRRIFGPKE